MLYLLVPLNWSEVLAAVPGTDLEAQDGQVIEAMGHSHAMTWVRYARCCHGRGCGVKGHDLGDGNDTN